MKRTFASLCLSLLCLLSGCQTSPTGRSQLMLVSDQDMNKMGAASFAALKQERPPFNDPVTSQYVTCLSAALLRAAGEQPNAWEVQVFKDQQPNAFALPGRKIGVNTGMIVLAQSAAQLAAVIGHEIGHVQARHGAERLSLNMASQGVQQIAAVAVEGSEYANLGIAALGLGAQYGVLLPYSRTHESEADRIGLQLMARAGFDPLQALALWQGKSRTGGASPPEFFSTHPANSTRIRELEAVMAGASELYQQARQQGVTPNCRKP